MKKIIIFLVLFLCFNFLQAQDSSEWSEKPGISFMGFLDVFYVYDFNKPEDGVRQPFFFNHNRHNEFNINLGLIQFDLTHKKYRATLALQAGTYSNDNYAAEPGVLKNIYEAKIGISLTGKNNLWLDAGIFGSHLGFESAVSMDNLTLTRSFTAESSPYYLSGVKLTYNPDEKWEFVLVACNGWQRITRVPGNSLISLGTQVSYTFDNDILINWSTFIGTDDPDPERRMRYFNNFYGIIPLADKFSMIAGFDIGFQQHAKGSGDYDVWFTPVAIVQYSISDKWKSAMRIEYFQDKKNIIIPVRSPEGFKTTALSLNLDYLPMQQIACRLEGRWLASPEEIYESPAGRKKSNVFIASSIAIKFQK